METNSSKSRAFSTCTVATMLAFVGVSNVATAQTAAKRFSGTFECDGMSVKVTFEQNADKQVKGFSAVHTCTDDGTTVSWSAPDFKTKPDGSFSLNAGNGISIKGNIEEAFASGTFEGDASVTCKNDNEPRPICSNWIANPEDTEGETPLDDGLSDSAAQPPADEMPNTSTASPSPPVSSGATTEGTSGTATSTKSPDQSKSTEPESSEKLREFLLQRPDLAMDFIMTYGSDKLKERVGLSTKKRFFRIGDRDILPLFADEYTVSRLFADYAEVQCSRLWGPPPTGRRYILKRAHRRGSTNYYCLVVKAPSPESFEIRKKHLSFDLEVGQAGFETGFPDIAFLGSAFTATVYPLPINLGFGLTLLRGLLIFSYQQTDIIPFTIVYTFPINLSKTKPLMSIDLFATGSYLNFDSIPAKGDQPEINHRYSPMATFGLNLVMPELGKTSSRESFSFLRLSVGYSVGKKTIRDAYLGNGFFLQLSAMFKIRKYKTRMSCTGINVETGNTVSRIEKCSLE